MDINAVNTGMIAGGNTLSSQTDAVKQGNFANMAVSVNDSPTSALENSAEELTFVKDNSKQTKLADRKQKQGRANLEQQINKIKAFSKAANQDTTTQKRIFKNWLNKGVKDKNSLLLELEKFGSSKSSIFTLLDEFQNEEGVDSDIKELLNNIKNEYFEENKSEIFATANALNAFETESPDRALYLSDTYSEFSHGSSDPDDILSFITAKFDKANIQEGIDYLFKALSCDLNSNVKSQDIEILNGLASALAKTKTLNATLSLINDFVSRISDKLKLQNTLNSSEFLSAIIKTSKDRFVTDMSILNLYKDKIKTKDPTDDVLVAQSLFKTLKEISGDVFANEDDRLKLVDATAKLVDKQIEKEDIWLEQGN